MGPLPAITLQHQRRGHHHYSCLWRSGRLHVLAGTGQPGPRQVMKSCPSCACLTPSGFIHVASMNICPVHLAPPPVVTLT